MWGDRYCLKSIAANKIGPRWPIIGSARFEINGTVDHRQTIQAEAAEMFDHPGPPIRLPNSQIITNVVTPCDCKLTSTKLCQVRIMLAGADSTSEMFPHMR